MSTAQVFLRPLANPLPLGFLALAGATLLVSGLQLEWLQPADGADVGLILLAFVFPLQLVVSVFGFLARDVVAWRSRWCSRMRWAARYCRSGGARRSTASLVCDSSGRR